MKCQKFVGDIPAYLDGELPVEKRSVLESHLKSCADCQERLTTMHATWDLLLKLPAPQVSGDFEARVWERIREEKSREPVFGWFPRFALVLSGFLLIWFVGTSIGTGFFISSTRLSEKPWAVSLDSLAGAYARRQGLGKK